MNILDVLKRKNRLELLNDYNNSIKWIGKQQNYLDMLDNKNKELLKMIDEEHHKNRENLLQHKSVDLTYYNSILKEQVNLRRKKDEEEIKLSYLESKRGYVIAELCKPIIVDVWNKYNNKHLGEKTEKKIRDEINNLIKQIDNNFCLIIRRYRYTSSISLNLLYKNNSNNDVIYSSNELLKGNVIQSITNDSLEHNQGKIEMNREYNKINEDVRILLTLEKEYNQKIRELEDLRKSIDDLKPSLKVNSPNRICRYSLIR